MVRCGGILTVSSILVRPLICISFKIAVAKASSPRMGHAASGGSWRMDLQLLYTVLDEQVL